MKLVDLIPYFELYKKLKDEGKDSILNKELEKKEKEFTGKEITLLGVVCEINKINDELIATFYPSGPEDYSLTNQRLISPYYFIFASTSELPTLLENQHIEKDDLVKMVGTLTSLHRHSTLCITLSVLSTIKKNRGQMTISQKAYPAGIRSFFRKYFFKRSSI